MIYVYTKPRHIKKINNFLDSNNIEHKIFTEETLGVSDFDLGVSYCYPRKIKDPLLFAIFNPANNEAKIFLYSI